MSVTLTINDVSKLSKEELYPFVASIMNTSYEAWDDAYHLINQQPSLELGESEDNGIMWRIFGQLSEAIFPAGEDGIKIKSWVLGWLNENGLAYGLDITDGLAAHAYEELTAWLDEHQPTWVIFINH